jgi:hypothetical protein
MDPQKKRLLSLHYLLRRARITEKYHTPSAIKELIVLTDAGMLLMEAMKKRLPDVSENSLYYGFLLDMYHKEFWIDSEQTDVSALIDLFDQLFYSGGLQVPWMFGRDLYDNYYRLFAEQKEALSLEETADLLANTPIGVAQIGHLLVGPFGILENISTPRPILPAYEVPLWHCMDMGCEQLHAVELKLACIDEIEIADAINDAAVELLGEGVDWGNKFRQTFPYKSNFYDDVSVNDIASVLITCLSGVELKNLCTQLLISNSAHLRGQLKLRGANLALFKNSGSVIASKLSREQCLQMVLLLDDKTIIDTLERLIQEGMISIPNSEIRTSRLGGRGPSGWLGMYSEVSQFGFRRVAASFPNITIAIARLRKLILDFYEDRRIGQSNLLHLLRFSHGDSASQKLDDYISRSDPRTVVRDLISIHDKGLTESISYLKFGYAPELKCIEDESAMINKILWKLGFSVPFHSSVHSTFENRLDALLSSSREVTNSSEAERERTRSAGVNLFVSLEELLDLSLSYSSWLCLSDHFGRTRFRFKVSDARAIAAKYLSGKKISSTAKLELKKDGKNTLFPLIEGMRILGEHICALRKKSSKKFLRTLSDEPGYAGKNSLERFPFLHTLFLYDMNEGDVGRCSDLLIKVSAILSDGKICDIRNRLEHKRDDFPSREEIEQCSNAISGAMKLLIGSGLCPVEYYRTETRTDVYGRIVHTFENYSGKRVSLNRFPSHLLSYNPPNDGPIAITPFVHIGDSADIFYADIVHVSEYVEMWKDYPKRREHVESPANINTITPVAAG